jgi:hypothetical protein
MSCIQSAVQGVSSLGRKAFDFFTHPESIRTAVALTAAAYIAYGNVFLPGMCSLRCQVAERRRETCGADSFYTLVAENNCREACTFHTDRFVQETANIFPSIKIALEALTYGYHRFVSKAQDSFSNLLYRITPSLVIGGVSGRFPVRAQPRLP